ncbi:hypothetical protein SLA2020_458280 [Shorea laevis]
MGDLLGSPRVAPRPFYCLFLLPSPPLAISFPPGNTCECGKTGTVFISLLGVSSRRRISSAPIGGCDHTSTNAPDPIRTPQLSVLGRE